MNKSVFGANDEYVQQTKVYGRIDALLALILYVTMVFLFVLMGKIFVHEYSNLTETYIFCVTGLFSIACIGLVFLFCFLRKQKLDTVGFSKKQAIRSLVIGIILLLLVIIFWDIKPFISGSITNTDSTLIVMRIIYFLVFIGFMEELTIRGYIGTRLYGYFKNKRLSVVITGIMFAMLHVPFHMIMAHMSLLSYRYMNFWGLIFIAIIHCLFQWFYSKYNSIIGPTIFHFIWDFSQWFIA